MGSRAGSVYAGTLSTALGAHREAAELGLGDLRSQIEAATYLELGTSPSPGLSLRDGPNAYRIAVVRGKLVAESVRNGKPIVKVLLDNGDADR